MYGALTLSAAKTPRLQLQGPHPFHYGKEGQISQLMTFDLPGHWPETQMLQTTISNFQLTQEYLTCNKYS